MQEKGFNVVMAVTYNLQNVEYIKFRTLSFIYEDSELETSFTFLLENCYFAYKPQSSIQCLYFPSYVS